ncbi:purine-nucleoside phosphorylase [Pendulispora albinea]|uniref:Purine nucleoside phosphorylase n=1 Tax=Pendulispora albinea TaxID=2741071 RepID=A0ABZ2LXB7_9BACT
MSTPAATIAARLDATKAAILARIPSAKPKVGLVLGSGLGPFADTLQDLVKIPYGELPHLPASKVFGHAGNLCFGKSSNVEVVCMQGRAHAYEGHPLESVVHGVRTMARLGASTILLTNAVGGLVPTWSVGDLMVISDHLNLTGQNVLIGTNEDALGTRFPEMSEAYDLGLRAALHRVAAKHGITLREGVYAGLSGPCFETPAEVRMLQLLGAHAVGMSTVQEVIALRHMRVRVGALSCVTNVAGGTEGNPPTHQEVEETARAKRDELQTLLSGWIAAAGELP